MYARLLSVEHYLKIVASVTMHLPCYTCIMQL